MAAKLSHPFDVNTDITLGGVDGQVRLVWYIDYTSRRAGRYARFCDAPWNDSGRAM